MSIVRSFVRMFIDLPVCRFVCPSARALIVLVRLSVQVSHGILSAAESDQPHHVQGGGAGPDATIL